MKIKAIKMIQAKKKFTPSKVQFKTDDEDSQKKKRSRFLS